MFMTSLDRAIWVSLPCTLFVILLLSVRQHICILHISIISLYIVLQVRSWIKCRKFGDSSFWARKSWVLLIHVVFDQRFKVFISKLGMLPINPVSGNREMLKTRTYSSSSGEISSSLKVRER